MPVNVLLLLADDMNYNSPGCYGSPVAGITPNLDRLAAQGIRFDHAHVTIGVCQPSRQSMLTGLYPHHNGAPGFDPIREDVVTLPETLRRNGYLNGIIGKTKHCAPEHKFAWDFFLNTQCHEYAWGRSPQVYGREAAKFFARAKEEGKPFFLMANSHDPHRPFAGAEDELLPKFFGYHTWASRTFTPEEVNVPGFLPDLPDVRREVAQYYTSVYRFDEMAGAVLDALEEAGHMEDTLVVFMSDNGMAFPFAKANCYLNSTKTPFIARWPGHIAAGGKNTEDYIAGIDFMPTVLEALGIQPEEPMDGRSYLPLLLGKSQPGRDRVFTQFNTTSNKGVYPMRCLQNGRFGYIFNAWSDGEKLFKNEAKNGLTYKAMVRAAEEDAFVAARVRMFDYRCKEEFYDFERDPDGLDNLAGREEYQDQLEAFRRELLSFMTDSGDPVLGDFQAYLAAKDA